MWLLIFPEGTNLSAGTRAKSATWASKQGIEDMKHLLLPRSKGLQPCLQRLHTTTDWLYDCTMAYEGIPPGQYGQDIFTLQATMLQGKPPTSVNLHFRRFRIKDIPFEDEKAFETWLRNRWREKDYLLEYFARVGRFPRDVLWMLGADRGVSGAARYIETRIGTRDRDEILDVVTPFVVAAAMLKALNARPKGTVQGEG